MRAMCGSREFRKRPWRDCGGGECELGAGLPKGVRKSDSAYCTGMAKSREFGGEPATIGARTFLLDSLGEQGLLS
jgi:hypothetical protein